MSHSAHLLNYRHHFSVESTSLTRTIGLCDWPYRHGETNDAALSAAYFVSVTRIDPFSSHIIWNTRLSSVVVKMSSALPYSGCSDRFSAKSCIRLWQDAVTYRRPVTRKSSCAAPASTLMVCSLLPQLLLSVCIFRSQQPPSLAIIII